MAATFAASLGFATPNARAAKCTAQGGTHSLPRSGTSAGRCLGTRFRDLYSSVAIVAVVASLASACADAPTGVHTTQSANRGLDGGNATLPLTHALTPAGELFGAVALQSSPDRTLLFMSVDQPRDGAKPDGLADYVFMLQLEQPLVLPILYRLEAARVSYSPRHVVATNGRRTLRLDLDEQPFHAARTATGAGDGQQFGWRGYGLSRRAGQWRLVSGALNSVSMATCGLPPGDLFTTSTTGAPASVQPFTVQDCKAGGYTSSHCSINCAAPNPAPEGWVLSCSTTCTTGFYACCNCFDGSGANCKCARCPPGEC
jgi:hypothetical protein